MGKDWSSWLHLDVWRATKRILRKEGHSRRHSPENEGGKGANKGITVNDRAPWVTVFSQQVSDGAQCSLPLPHSRRGFPLYSYPRAAAANWVAQNDRNVLSHSPGSWKSQIEVSAGLCSPGTTRGDPPSPPPGRGGCRRYLLPLPWLAAAATHPPPLLSHGTLSFVSVCVQISLLEGC